LLCFLAACVFLAKGQNDIHTFEGQVDVGVNGSVGQIEFFTNNSFNYAPISMSIVIHSVTNVANDTAFSITQSFQIVDTIRKITLIASSDDFEGTEETFTPVTIDNLFGPCLAPFLITPSTDLQFITAFSSNVSLTLDITYVLTIFNASITDGQAITVPTQQVQYFTFISPTFGLTSSFDLRFAIINTTGNSNVSAAFSSLTVGCPGLGGVVRTYNLANINVMQFAASLSGLRGAVTIALTAVNSTVLPEPNWLFVINDAPDSSSDDDLEGWQIALIVIGCVAGAVLLATVVGVAVWFIRRRSDYSSLTG